MARAAGVRAATVALGVDELDAGGEPLGRARRPGGGRKRSADLDPGRSPGSRSMPVATVSVLGWLTRRHRRVGLFATVLVVAQAIGWSAVWAPQTLRRWLRVPAATAAALGAVEARIPASAAVFASQGVVGRFAGRYDVQPIDGTLSLSPGQDWFIFTPWAGIETQTTEGAMVFAGELAGPCTPRW